MTPIDLATAIITAVREAATAYYKWLEGRDIRRRDAAIDAAESYILANEDDKLAEKDKKKLLKHFAKRFWKWN